MSVYAVTWNLNKEGLAYNAARQKLLLQLATYQHIKDNGLDSVWFISTDQTADQITDHLLRALDANDGLLVTRMRQVEHQGWLRKNTWDWIEPRI